ncbi:hypothetical protein HS088_TW03G00420 [Tripterygium wilfordii]|uniref:Ubiquitin-like domain-containing protein n=1 Tax=Tripterygium wilfordii TaxID=458696 RepID=A0A7J7DUP1_TRIWF|nr:hypothetical protein HS088_TW03G00420 [Tripterygium wilfordii]
MRVVVEILTGNLFYIQLGNDATIADLKREIEAQQNLPRDRLILINLDKNQCHCNYMISRDHEDGASLVDCGIHDVSYIYLFFNSLDDGSNHRFVFTWPDCLIG